MNMNEPNSQDSKMTLLSTGHDDEKTAHFSNHPVDMTTMTSLESDAESPSKRTNIRKVSTAEETGPAVTPEQLEAKRLTNRLSARRCRLRQKNLIRDLQNENSVLKMENKNLRLRLELSLAEAKKLELTHNQEMRRHALRRSHALQSITQRRTQDSHMSSLPPRSSATTASALLQLAAGQSRAPELVPPSPPRTDDHHVRAERQIATQGAPMFPRLASNIQTANLSSSLATSRNILATQQQIENLRNEVKTMKEFLTRPSV